MSEQTATQDSVILDDLNIDQMEDEKPSVTASNGSEAPVEDDVDELEVLRPKADVKKRTIGKDAYERTYEQKPLSFFGKMEFFKLVGGVVDAALDAGTSVDSLLGGVMSGPRGGSSLTTDDLRQADQFVMVAAKLTEHAPDFLLDSFCIWLRVPEADRTWTKEVLKDELDDVLAMDIIETFIDQNVAEIEDFFTKLLPQVARRIGARRKENKESSKQSKRSAQKGQKQ